MPFYIVRDATANQVIREAQGRAIARTSDGTLWCAYGRQIAGLIQIFAAYSGDNGVTWIEEQVSFAGGPVLQTFGSAIAIDSNDNVHLVSSCTVAGGIMHVLYCMRTAGVGWGLMEDLAPLATRAQATPVIAVDSMDNVHIVWMGSDWGAFPLVNQILYIQKTGGIWGAITLTTDANAPQRRPSIVIDSGNILHLVWEGHGWGANPAIYNIRYRQRSATGVWSASEPVTDEANNQALACISLDSSMNPHVAWHGLGWPVNPADQQVQYRARIAGVWGAREAIGGDAVNETNASISLDTLNIIHVFWNRPVAGLSNVRYRARTSGVWGGLVYLTHRAFAQGDITGLFAYHPVISGVSTNIPGEGYLMLLDGQDATGTQIEYWIPTGFVWKIPPAPPPVPAISVMTLPATGVT